MEKRVLMVAYHYPPCTGSSGLQRTLSFARHLERYGWSPLVLTAAPRAYRQTGFDQLADSPASVAVTRAFALDTARSLSIWGWHPGWLAVPDAWISWFLGAVPAGLRVIRRHRPSVLWSTYPIATAHLIGAALQRLTGLPWVADFRDPMTEVDPVSGQRWPEDPLIWRARCWIERLTIRGCARAVFVAPQARQIYAERYAEVPERRWIIIPNGYDEEIFNEVERAGVGERDADRGFTLLHSGTLYPSPDRDPSAFFAALTRLRGEGTLPRDFRVVFRASGYEEHYRQLIRSFALEDVVLLKPAVPYREALAEMLCADGLLLIQGHDSNPAIPAKLYEYVRARRPVLALVDRAGDTARMLASSRIGTIAPPDSAELIAHGVLEFLQQIRAGVAAVAGRAEAERHSREARTAELARLLDEVEDEAQIRHLAGR
jgi:glycosyltransferase involved in cell wall biosynthesis